MLRRKFTSRIVVRPDNISLYVQDGKIVAAAGYRPLGELLISQGLVTPEDVAQAHSMTGRLGQNLLSMRVISSLQLRSALRTQASETLMYLLGQNPQTYEVFASEPMPLPSANIDGQELIDQLIGEQPLALNTVYQLARLEQPINIEPRSWELVRHINGRRSLNRVIQAAGFPLQEGQTLIRELIQKGLIEQSLALSLRFITPKRLPLSSTTHPPSSIRANLFLKYVDGQRNAWTIQDILQFPTEEAISTLTSLYREKLVEIVHGEREFNLLLDEF